ncbi:hypothetical protein Tsubulata_005021, partial [Turnera subulata]
MNQRKMAPDRIRTRREDKIVTLYNIDPAFYRKIISRNSSGGCSGRLSLYYQHHRSGKVPFNWERKPGQPRDAPEDSNQIVIPPVTLPPSAPIRVLSVTRRATGRPPCTGPRAFFLKKLKKMKMIKNTPHKQPPPPLQPPQPAVQGLPPLAGSKSRSSGAKKFFKKEMKKLKQISGVHKGKSKVEHKPEDGNTTTDERDVLGFSSSETSDFTSSSTNSSTSSSSSSSSSSFTRAIKSPK